MADRPIVKGGQPFQFRNGADGFYWKGMATKVDPGAQPPDRPRRVYNGRFIGGNIQARQPFFGEVATIPHYTGPNSTDITWHPHALLSHHSYAGVRLWFGSKIPIDSSDVGGTFGYVDSDWSPEFNEVALVYNENGLAPQMERFANFVYVGGMESLKRIYRFEGAPGKLASSYGTLPSDEVVVSFPGFHITALHRHAGKLYFVLADPADAVTGYIYSWNGFESVQEVALSVSGHQGAAMATYFGSLVVTVKGDSDIHVQDIDGSWSTATVGGFAASGYFNSMAALKDKLYIMSGTDEIYSWDGTSLVLAHTITGGTAPEEANCCVAWNGRLYYGWSELIATDAFFDERWPWLGVFDPDTVDASYDWTDDYKDFNHSTGNRSVSDGHDTGGLHPYLDWGVVTAMAVYRQRLMVAVGTTRTDTDKYTNIVTHSDPNNPFSDWYIAHPNSFSVLPTGPLYFGLLSAEGGSALREMDYFKVL